MIEHLNPFHIPKNKKEFVTGLVLHAAIGHAANAAFTYMINENLARHYAETRTPMHARHYQAYRGPSMAERFGRTVGLVALNPATPVIAGGTALTLATVAASVSYERKINEEIRDGQSNVWHGPFASGFGPVV